MGSYTVEPGETPLDDSFRDTRVAVNGTWEQPLGRLSLLALGAHVSTEYDFFSVGANAVLSRDFNERNTRLTLGLSLERDAIDPVGDVPIPFAAMAPAGSPQPRRGSSETKLVVDGLLGLTQVLDERTLAQLNYSLSRADGYLNDPYKIVGVVDPATGDPLRYLYEERPGTRTKHALYWLLRRHLGRDIASGSYRFLVDDWGILSHTVDLNYRWKPSERWWLEPHLRFYRQSQADFYRLQLLDGEPLPGRASSDYRLAAFKGYTVGLQHGWTFENETALIVKAEYYFTRGEQDPGGVLPSQRGLQLYPDMKATILQVQYRF